MATAKRIVWDACAWIALISKEGIIADGIERYTRCFSVIEQARQGKIEIALSALCLAEVCKDKSIRTSAGDSIAAYFQHDYLLVVALGREIAEKARFLMASGAIGLKPSDACHLATALEVPRVTELHTFDERLLACDMKLQKRDGVPLRILYPDVSGNVPPLLAMSKPN